MTGDRAARAGGFNDTVHGGWFSAGDFGLDQGLILLMIENFRSGLLWRLLHGSAPIRTGLHRAGFRGGWFVSIACASTCVFNVMEFWCAMRFAQT
ncbi:glucoamylase family protein [uncultured Lamprocystis sp.]|uniref:glucoamylase family protein n=1 Tax=uncultured Lamprocystis sp. TaxID=543132 RepID=UPI0025D13AE7|nr:glucoamylase family protein [uncultured Lamprocystis sp.]